LKRKPQTLLALLLLGALSVSILTGCSSKDAETESENFLIESDEDSETADFASETETVIKTEDAESEETDSEETNLTVEDLFGFVSSVDDDGILALALASDGVNEPVEDYTALDRTLYSETGVTYDYDPSEASLVCLFTDGYFIEGSADEIIAGDFIVISSALDEQGELSVTLFVYPEAGDGSDQ